MNELESHECHELSIKKILGKPEEKNLHYFSPQSDAAQHACKILVVAHRCISEQIKTPRTFRR